MKIVGIGVDIIENSRINRLISNQNLLIECLVSLKL